jgi:mono/diheme cytochrome c family protein
MALAACAGMPLADQQSPRPDGAETTFEKFLIDAQRDDPVAQNLIGYMLYFGQGTSPDKANALFWFERAARQGHHGAQLNLAFIHHTGVVVPRNPKLAAHYYEAWRATYGARSGGLAHAPRSLSETIERIRNLSPKTPSTAQSQYETYCAGCHGLNGIAEYVGSPSFAIGERLQKSNSQLLASIANGHSVMPAWRGLLSAQERRLVLTYIRTFPERYQKGVVLPVRDVPEHYFTFGPMRGTELDR